MRHGEGEDNSRRREKGENKNSPDDGIAIPEAVKETESED